MLGMMARKGKGGGGRLRNEEQKMALWLRREQCLLLWNYTPFMPLLMRDRGRRYGRRSSRLSYDSASFVTSFLPSFPCLAFEPPRRHNAPWLIPRATGFQYSNGGASHHLLSLSLSSYLLLSSTRPTRVPLWWVHPRRGISISPGVRNFNTRFYRRERRHPWSQPR